MQLTSRETFNGSDYDPAVDYSRLNRQFDRVRAVMSDGLWHTTAEVAKLTGDPAESVSRQMRYLRDEPNQMLDKRIRGERLMGMWEYRILRITTGN